MEPYPDSGSEDHTVPGISRIARDRSRRHTSYTSSSLMDSRSSMSRSRSRSPGDLSGSDFGHISPVQKQQDKRVRHRTTSVLSSDTALSISQGSNISTSDAVQLKLLDTLTQISQTQTQMMSMQNNMVTMQTQMMSMMQTMVDKQQTSASTRKTPAAKVDIPQDCPVSVKIL